MTDLSSRASGLPRSGQASPGPSKPLLVNWDPLLRMAHWGLAVVVVANSFFTKEGGSVHVAFGWAGLGLLILRLIWGFVGPREARFSSFPPNPLAALRHLGKLVRGRIGPNDPPHPSHNPAGAMMAYALWACLAVLIGTGLVMTGATPMRQAELEAAVAAGDWSVLVEEGEEFDEDESALGEIMEEVHEVAANLILLLAVLHIAGVMVESLALKRNLAAAMVFRKKGT